jgi:hypothetical protein
MKLTKAQREILTAIRGGAPFCEYLTPDHDRLFFRTLGDKVPAKLNYVLTTEGSTLRVGYKTFWVLFKNNLITPSKYRGSLSPQDGITQFHITQRGYELLQGGA